MKCLASILKMVGVVAWTILCAVSSTLAQSARSTMTGVLALMLAALPISTLAVYGVCDALGRLSMHAENSMLALKPSTIMAPIQGKDKSISIEAVPGNPKIHRPLVELDLFNVPAYQRGSLGKVTVLRRYQITAESGEILGIVEVSQVRGPRERQEVRIDLALESDGQWTRIPWWQGQAPSAAILVVEQHSQLPWLKQVKFPTTTSAFCAYLGESFVAQRKLLATHATSTAEQNAGAAPAPASGGVAPPLRLTPEQMQTTIAAPLKQHLKQDTLPLTFNWGVVGMLLLSDTVQFATTWLAVTWGMLQLVRLLVNVVFQDLMLRIFEAAQDRSSLLVRLAWCERWLQPLLGAKGVCEAVRSALESRPADRRRRAGSALACLSPPGWPDDRLSAGITLGGFAGTLIFLSLSLLYASDLISKEQTQIISALSSFGLLMSAAFTTTMWAAALEYPLSIFAEAERAWVRRVRRRFATRIQRLAEACNSMPRSVWTSPSRRKGPAISGQIKTTALRLRGFWHKHTFLLEIALIASVAMVLGVLSISVGAGNLVLTTAAVLLLASPALAPLCVLASRRSALQVKRDLLTQTREQS